MIRKIILFAFVGLLLSCTAEKKSTTLECGVPRLEMVYLLMDLHKADAALSAVHFNSEQEKDSVAIGSYKYVLQKYDMTREEFEKTMDCYADNIKVLNEIYDEVLAKMSQE